jgi:thioredoxin 1
MSIKKLDETNFKSTIENSDKPIVIDFYADWCGPCKVLLPKLEELAKENESFIIYKLNVDDAPAIAEQFSIMTIPNLVVFKDGKEYNRVVNPQSKDSIIEAVK